MTKQPEIVWHKGPPPLVGWWCAGFNGERSMWRYWFGKAWSQLFWNNSDFPLDAIPLHHLPFISWCNYWPENARVLRIDPRKAKSEKAMQKLAALNQEIGL
jgi:hypothetical protein